MKRKWVGVVAQQDRSAVQRVNKARKRTTQRTSETGKAYVDNDELRMNEILD